MTTEEPTGPLEGTTFITCKRCYRVQAVYKNSQAHKEWICAACYVGMEPA